MPTFFSEEDVDIRQLESLCFQREVSLEDYPWAVDVERNVTIYDGQRLRETLEDERTQIRNQVSRLISVCEKRCRHFRVFFISSLGAKPSSPEKPPENLEPQGVLKPLFWILGQ